MKVEVWFEGESYQGDNEGMIRLYMPELNLVIDPKFDGRISGVETWDYTKLESWEHLKPYLIKEEWTYLGEL